MLIAEARDLVARHTQNQKRITTLRQALEELKPSFAESATTTARLAVQVGSQPVTITTEIPKDMAMAIFTAELTRLVADQTAVERVFGSIA